MFNIDTKKIHILLVEDNAEDRRLARLALLKGEPSDRFTIEEAETLSQATKDLERRRCDVVLLDLRLPDSDGLDAIARIRETNPDAAIVVLTCIDDEEMGIDALRAGAYDYLVKGPPLEYMLRRTIVHSLERKRIESRLKISEERFKMIYENAPVLINAFDKNGCCILWNKQCEKTFGWTLVQINSLGEPLALLYPDPEIRRQIFETVTSHPDKEFREWHPVTKNGTERKILWANFELPDGRIVNLGHDITDQRKTEESLEEANRQLTTINRTLELTLKEVNKASEAKSEFLANMSHEIRTPMNSVIGFAALLEDLDLTEVQQEYVKMIRQNGNNLMMIINDILDFSKIEAGQLETEISQCKFSQFLQEIESMFRFLARQKGLDFQVLKSDELPPVIYTDPYRLQQCLVNLINNALKFTEKGHVYVNVSSEWNSYNEPFIRFDVEDTGIGVAREKQDLIFDSFSQADSSSSRKYGGTGLGLAITKRLATLLNGTISLKSHPGKGSVFTLRIPSGTACLQESCSTA